MNAIAERPQTRPSASREADPDAMRRGRLEAGLSLRDLRDELLKVYKVKIDHGQLSRLERGETRTPRPGVRKALCDYFELPYDYFDDEITE